MSKTIKMIPLSKLRRSKANIRKTAASADIESLAASIEAHGLLQNLTVRSAETASGRKRGAYEVVAGACRLTALRQLAKRKRISKDLLVPCRMLGAKEAASAAELSLAENIVRAPLHPADQFQAFSKLHADGLGAEDIAARFGISPTLVLQRLKLAAVSPRLMADYREGGMTLDQLTAFAISDDVEAQERVWFDIPYSDKTPQAIRRALTKTLVEGSDRRARFVGAEAYEAAGGTIVRDLFQPDDAGYFTDSALLDRLVAEKLAAEAAMLEQEGWSWVEVLPEMDFSYLARHGRIPATDVPLPPRKQKKLDRLCTRHDELVVELDDDSPEAVVAELDCIEAEIEALSPRREQWSNEDKARAGAMVSLTYEGGLVVTRGIVKREKQEVTDQAGDENGGSPRSQRDGSLPEALLEDLSAHRTAALRAALSEHPEIALTALLYSLVLQTLYGEAQESCIHVQPIVVDLTPLADGIGESRAVAAMTERHQQWVEQLPAKSDLWKWLSTCDLDTKLGLLAYCIAATVNAVWKRNAGIDRERLLQAEMFATVLGLDMADWWQPTRERYLDRVTKERILAAVAEGVSRQAAENIARLKKPAMAAQAEELLADTRWLPEPLRTVP